MNQLRQLMLEELQRRNFAESTIRSYLHGVAHLSRYFRRPPDQLGPEDIRKYQAMLPTFIGRTEEVSHQNLAKSTITSLLAAMGLPFFVAGKNLYCQTAASAFLSNPNPRPRLT